MRLAVDETTAHLVQELQASMNATIEGLRSGQRELLRLVEEIRQLQQGFAQSAQVDEVYELVDRVSADMEEKASAGQVNAAAGEVKALLTDAKADFAGIRDAQDHVLEDTKALLKAQKELGAGLQDLTQTQEAVPQAVSALLADKLQVLLTLEEKFDDFSSLLNAQKEELVCSAQNALNAANRNQSSLNAIMAYLSLPGYKRFFKGMEVPADEAPA